MAPASREHLAGDLVQLVGGHAGLGGLGHRRQARGDHQAGPAHRPDLLGRLQLDVVPAAAHDGSGRRFGQRRDRPLGDVLDRCRARRPPPAGRGRRRTGSAARSARRRRPAGAGRSRPGRRRAGTARRRTGRRCPSALVGSYSTCQMWPHLRHIRRPDSRRTTSSLSTSSSRTTSSEVPEVAEHRVELVGLGDVAREAVEQEAGRRVRLAEPVTHHRDGDLVGHQVAGVHVGLGQLAELGAAGDVGPEDVAGRDLAGSRSARR